MADTPRPVSPPPSATPFEERVAAVIRRLGPGQIATYGEIAAEAGSPMAARAVGNVLARHEGLPWWRVVTSSGRLVPHHEAEQRRLLAREGIEVAGGGIRRRPPTPA